jgi:hypothetical protein
MAQSQLPLPVRIALEDQRLLRSRRAVTSAVRSPVRPATRRMRVVSMPSARPVAGMRVGHRRASLDVPAPGAEQDVCPLICGATTGILPTAAGQAQGRA